MKFLALNLVLLLLLFGLLHPPSAYAQSSGQAADELLLENMQTGKTRRIQPGEKIVVIGHPATQPIRGRLVKASDSLTLELKNGLGQRAIPVSEITEISHPRPGLTVFVLVFLLTAGFGLVWTGYGVATSALAIVIYLYFWDFAITTAITLLAAGLALLFNHLRRRPYSMKKWRIVKSGNNRP